MAGSRHSGRILAYYAATELRATTDEIPRCSSYVNWCMAAVGVPGPRSAAGRSWLAWGSALFEPRPGCIVVLQRGSSPTSGHAAFCAGGDRGRVRLLGGNQGDAVCDANYSASRVIGYRFVVSLEPMLYNCHTPRSPDPRRAMNMNSILLRALPLLTITLLSATPGCTPAASVGAGAPGLIVVPGSTEEPTKTPRRSSRRTITTEEIRATQASNAYQVIQRLRPEWVRARSGASGGTASVYHNMIGVGSVAQLEHIPASGMISVRYLSGIEAKSQFGSGHTMPAILITTN